MIRILFMLMFLTSSASAKLIQGDYGACCIEDMQNECTDNVTEQDCNKLG
ncbi:MAG: hypothetical protein ACI9JK_001304, partial [Phycisphaerales bacterium]